MIRLAALLLVCFANNVQAAQVTETFSSRTYFDSGAAIPSEAVWNQTLGKIHPTLLIYNTTYNPGGTTIPVNVGDGRHGAFDSPATYANFGTTSGTTIYLDTARFPELNVTRFQLDSPWVLEPFGPNPLIIRSQTDVIISGTINCNGGNGGNAAGAVSGAGGIGRCGGKDGGAGGVNGVNGGDGTSGIQAALTVTGGTAGASIESSGGGGGGGWHSNIADDGINSTVGGIHGESLSDPEFSTLAGGAGGGGGASVGADAGGGGGAGGGAVLIYAVGDFELTDDNSFIYANGGNGGNGSGTGTAGGGGGGGSVLVFVGGETRMYNTDATLGGSQANGGAGGTLGVAGGKGAFGRSWITGTDYDFSGPVNYSPAEEFPADNYAFFNASKQSVVTKPFDLFSTIPVLSSLALTPVSLDFSVEFAGSDDGFASDDTGWQPSLAAIQGKRFVRFKFSIETSSTTTPSMIDSAVLTYAAGIREDFDFKSAGCGRIANGSATPPAGFLFISFFVFLFAGVLKFKARKSKRTRLD